MHSGERFKDLEGKLNGGPPAARIVDIPPKMQLRLGAGTLLIPRLLDVDAVIRTVAEGRCITVSRIRRILADQAGATTTCPLVTGIAIRIAAEVAAEDELAGRNPVTPYWRVIRDDGTLMDKFPGGPRDQARRLRGEGHVVSVKGRKLRLTSSLAGF